MDWGIFFTILVQAVIVMLVLFVTTAVVIGIVQHEKKSPRDPRDGTITNIWNNNKENDV